MNAEGRNEPGPRSRERPDDEIEAEAAEWISRQEGRVLTPEEAAQFRRWRHADLRHAEKFEELRNAWTAFDALRFFPRDQRLQPNADFFARPRRIRAWIAVGVAAAAAFAVGTSISLRRTATPERTVQPGGSEFVRLADGSEVELRTGSRMVEKFSPAERRVALGQGEAHFTVTKNAVRPFVVEAGGLAIRAVGTAFNVRISDRQIDVLVTEGRVRIEPSSLARHGFMAPVELVAGQRLTCDARNRETAPVVESVPGPTINRLLGWQSRHLVLDGTPLSEVVALFNRYGEGGATKRLRLADTDTGAVLISGRIRADNLDAFLELLEAGFGVKPETHGEEIVLRLQH